ncbi:MAG: hypothetical protein M0Z95_19355 [Actinomycetota bacterium]|nr:hypothetical protein [Actinomycetota bacterium]
MMRGAEPWRRWGTALGAILIAVTLLGATVQAGLLAPQFRSTSGGGTASGVTFENIENVSWRSWTITGVHLANPRVTRALLGGRIAGVSLHRGRAPSPFHLGLALRRLVVAPGQQFSVELANVRGVCTSSRRRSSLSTPMHISVVVSLSTPFGNRQVVESFPVC